MIEEKQGYLFGINRGIICQQVNCQGKYGAGLSGVISRQYSKIAKDYFSFCEKKKEPHRRLGSLDIVPITEMLSVANIFSQLDYGNSKKTGICYTKYNVLIGGIANVSSFYPDLPIYTPHSVNRHGEHTGIGCGLAGGDWNVVYTNLKALANSQYDNLYLIDTFTGEIKHIERG